MVSMTTHVPLPTPRLNEAMVRVRDAAAVAFFLWVPVALVLAVTGWRDQHHVGNVVLFVLFAVVWLSWSPAKWYGARLSPEDQYSWAWHRYYGLGKAKNLSEALLWAKLASDGGYVPAWALLGVMLKDLGDPEQGLRWLTKAAKAGDAYAQSQLGQMYLAGDGVPRDPAAGLDWLTRAAEQGDPISENYLGYVLAAGQFLEPRLDLAIAWFRKAASKHLPIAMENLGESLFKLSNGADQDVEALTWYLLAKAHGHSLDHEQLERQNTLTSRMTEPQIQKAEKAAREWLEANPASPIDHAQP